MTPERHRQITELYHAALEVGANDRTRFLERECAGDGELRREVESLLASYEQAPDFISEPAFEVAAALLASETDTLIGQMIAHYRVISFIGAGGMGQVYLAEDTALGRRVALKLLPEHFTDNRSQVQRFRQEARAASALNHPNILTIHEFGQAIGKEFIATEYIEGETLRERLSTPFVLRDALDVAVQIAGALVAAHSAGIIHRDIKPENVMLRRDGYVKVLDFGVAKLTENLEGLQIPNSALDTALITNSGMVRGTAQYMSPEQTRGLAVDARTDVWSLGVVLYEMVARQRPFEEATQSDTIVSILEREPQPLLKNMPEAPAELERIVLKALTKSVDERYQTARDLAIDLRKLRWRLGVEADTERFATPDDFGEPVTTDSRAPFEPERSVTEAGVAASTSSFEFAVRQIRLHKAVVALVSLLVIATLVVGGYGLYWLLTKNETKPHRVMKIEALTSDGSAKEAAISPDGRYVAYVLRQEERETLRVRQVLTSSEISVVPPAEAVFLGLTFSPDGNYIYYVTLQAPSTSNSLLESDATGTLYQVPVLGGASRRLVTGVDSAITFSPDGQRFAFVRAYHDRGETAVVIANADGSREQKLAVRSAPDVFTTKGRLGSGPAWSPDGKVIACGAGRFGRHQVVTVSAVDGSEQPLGSDSWQFLGRISWLPDGTGLLIVAVDQKSLFQIWQLTYPAGVVSRVTNDLNGYYGNSLDAHGSSLVTVQTEPRTQHLWLMTLGEPTARAKKLISIRGGTEDGPAWMPDGRIAYAARTGDKFNLWVMNLDGTEQKQLTDFTNSINVRPSSSPDGRYIVFVSDRAGGRNIWRVDSDGSNPVRLTSGDIETWPTCSPDSRWVVYSAIVLGKTSLWKIPIDGGEPVKLIGLNFAVTVSSISPDGKLIAYTDKTVQAGTPMKIVVIPFEGGDPIKTFDLPATAKLVVRWMPDGRELTYVSTFEGISNIWSQPLAGGRPKRIGDFNSDQLISFDWSRDGKQLVVTSGTVTSNVVVISDFR